MLREKLERVVFYLLLLFLPTQLGKHFWPDFAIISGIRVDYLSPTVYVTDIFVGLLFLIWLVNTVRNPQFTVQNDKQKFIIVFVILLLLLLNIFLSQNYLNGFYHLLKFLEFSFVAYYVALTVVRLDQVKKIFLFLSIGVIGQSLLAVAQFIKQGSLGGVFYLFGERLFTAATPGIANASINGELLLRPYGTFPHPNVLAGFLLLSMTGLLFTFAWTKGRERMVWTLALLSGSGALLLTMSRLTFLLWLILLVVIFLRQVSVSFVKPVFGLGFVILIVFLLAQTPFGTRLIQTNLAEEAVVQRTELIRSSVEMVAQQPLVGVGFGNFLPVLATVTNPLPLNLYLQPVHNIFLLVLAETGIIGLIFFLWFLTNTYKRLFQKVKKGQGIPYRIFIVLLSLLLVLGSFDHYFVTLQQGQLLLALILGLCWTNLRE